MSKLTALKNFMEVRWLRKFSDRAKLEKYQQKMLRKQLAFIKSKSPFYADKDCSRLENLPVMDK